MFTGLIEEVGLIQRVKREGKVAKLAIRAMDTINGLAIGQSIAVDGTCLTVTAIEPSLFEVDLSEETMTRTTLGELRPEDAVNLERPCRPTDRLGGHIVTGHIDGVGAIIELRETGGMWWLSVSYPQALRLLFVEKGSIAVDGISLTIADLTSLSFGVAIIPYTYRHTTLGSKQVGRRVNLETDLLGKYVIRYLEGLDLLREKRALTESYLQEMGYG
ncbi:MAG TPA: riboflavin synthase [Candidatus Methylomirabilis sp.]|nr:riboflavin synthase [Candidatus Methylomirabilis sp.]